MASFHSYFSVIHDMRQLHKLIDVLFITVAAFIAGADDWEIVILFAIAPKQFEKCFILWTKEIAISNRKKISFFLFDFLDITYD